MKLDQEGRKHLVIEEGKKSYIVYLATSPSGKHYVGITHRGLQVRIRSHKNEALSRNFNRKFHNAIRKYGIENIKFEVIDTVIGMKNAHELEKYYIQQYNSFKSGYNLTLGGDGTFGLSFPSNKKGKPFAGDKEKLSKSLKQYYIDNPKSRKYVDILPVLIQDYLNPELDLNLISEKYKINRNVITFLMKENGVELKNSGKKKIDKALLFELRINQKLPRLEIANVLGCSKGQVEKYIKLYGLYVNKRAA
jgi:group I intron endonuclease